MFRSLFKEPLVHFVLIGAALFALSAVFGGDEAERDEVIRITAGDIDRLAALWSMQYRRPPAEDEMAGLIENHVREEILNREARLLGLDRDDTIIRRRLAQKMEFLTEDLASMATPTEEQIAAYFEQNRNRYEIPAAATFAHIYFNTDRRGEERAEDAARALRDSLNALDPTPHTAERSGDVISLQHVYAARTKRDVTGLFGQNAFTETVFGAKPGEWTGPVASGYGLHIIYIHERSEPVAPGLDEVRDRVEIDYMSDRRRRANDIMFAELLKKYTVVIEPADTTRQ
jgi:hypothetical protein